MRFAFPSVPGTLKCGFSFAPFALTVLAATLFAGCLFKPVTVNTRHFILAPIGTNEPVATTTSTAATKEHVAVGVGFVKMPSYLLRNAVAIRNSANEIQYLEDARWGERLDQSFQHALAANLAGLLPSDRIYLSDWGRDQVNVQVFVSVQQFDVDATGHGTLIAQWRITTPGTDIPSKIGRTHLDRAGRSPRRDPEAVVTTMSELAAEFSRALAQSIRESTKPKDSIAGTVKAAGD